MSLVCGQCSRVNPAEASYCYHDGAALAGRSSGPINAGSAPFPNQFVFPNGLACRNFDQLAVACQQNWSAAVDLLKQGFLGSFFGSMGRVDLAMAAQESAKFPDIDRGLDQLIDKLPSQAVQPPKLQAEPSEVNLGQVKINQDRTTELHLTNLGMRLLYGTATSDCKWLTLGEAPGHAEKLFQFGSDMVIPVHVRGQHLRAGTKPLEGHLTIDSNGGTVTVTFRADVPITPFDGGLFAGAVTPRQIAEKSKANPKDAGPYFERGDVAKWYAANGWAYPVQGPTMPGMGGIQQFFEALGVAKAPKVEFSPRSMSLDGAVGKTIEATIEVTTGEKKVVYGWATCDAPWVEIGKTKLVGKSATIPITIRVPSPCPPTLEATLNVIGNGNQRLAVPLRVQVTGGKAGVALKPPAVVYDSLEIVEDKPLPSVQLVEAAPPPVVVVVDSPQQGSSPFAFGDSPAPPSVQPVQEEAPFAVPDRPSPSGIRTPSGGLPMPLLMAIYLAPIVVLSFCLLVPLVHDIFFAGEALVQGGDNIDPREVDSRKFIEIRFDEGRAGANYTDSMMFAVHKIDPEGKTESKKLNYYDNGFGNSVVVKIDDTDNAFGNAPNHGKWAKGFEARGKDVKGYDGKLAGKTRTFEFSKGIVVTQTVTLVPSDLVENPATGEYKRLLNTCLVRYKIENKDSKPHRVGLRVLMDTCIGDNDGAPFNVPGVNDIVTKGMEFKDPKPRVPDYVQVLEKSEPRDWGVVVHLGLRISDKFEAPSRFQITHYPVNNQKPDKSILNKWEVAQVDFDNDSAVVMYWDPRELAPNSTPRQLGFTYGLGSLSADKLAVTVGGGSHQGAELSVIAYVSDDKAKTAKLTLPKGLTLLDGQQLEQTIPAMRPDGEGKLRPMPVSWRVRAAASGKHDISVKLNTGPEKARRITISDKSLFN